MGHKKYTFADFLKQNIIPKVKLAEAIGVTKQQITNLSNSKTPIFVRYNSRTGAISIVRPAIPETVVNSGNIKQYLNEG